MNPANGGQEGAKPPVNPRIVRAVTLLVASAFFMEMLDSTVIATALPHIGESFGVDAVSLSMGVTAYLLALAVFIPVSGWIADRFGGRTVFASALALFTFSSLLCGLSTSLGGFTAARLLQGAGGAAMVPVGRLLVLRMTEKKDIVKAIGTIIWPGLVAPVLGPPVGGFIVLHLSWPWIFFLNIPLGLAAIGLTFALVPNARPEGPPRPLDFVGFLLSGGALALLVYGVDALGAGHGSPTAPLFLIAVGLALAFAGVRHFRSHPTPLLDLSPLAIPTFAVAVWGGSVLRIAIGTLPFLLPLLFQLGFGLDAQTSGELVLFVFAGNLAMKLFTTQILHRFGFRAVMVVNGLLAAVAIAACALFRPDTSYWVIAPVLFFGGAFRSMQFTCINTIQLSDVPPEKLTDANTLASMLQQLMMGMGVVVGAALLNASALLRGRPSGAPQLVDFRTAFCVIALIAVIGLIDSLMLDRNAGGAVIRSRAPNGGPHASSGGR